MATWTGGHICQCLSRLATLRQHSNVVIAGNRRVTGEQFVKGTLSLAHGLRQLGVRPGDVVAIVALNRDLYLEWLLAVTYIGGIAAPLNYRWSLEEARVAVKIVAPVMLVTDESCSHWYSEILSSSTLHIRWHVSMSVQSDLKATGNVLCTGELKKSLVTSQSFSYSWAPECVAFVCFTSGTTGRPKGVKISHSALIVQSLAKIAIVDYDDGDVYLHTTPLCHIGGISSAMAVLMVGGCHVILPKFEAESALDAIEKQSVTSLITVPAIMNDLVSLIRTKENWEGKQSVKKILNGGGSLSGQLINEAVKFFPRAKLLSAYGMTEACSSLTYMTLYDPRSEISNQPPHMPGEKKSSSAHQLEGVCVGKPAPHVEMRINVKKSCHVGRIFTRGPHMMIGYWDAKLAKMCDHCEEGWFDTGDIGQIDDRGNVWLVGRASGRIKSGGESVYPEEVEAVVSQHPGISGAVVVGVPDARLTEMVVACCHLKDGWHWIDGPAVTGKRARLSTEILREYCKEKSLTGFKIPKDFVVWRKPFPFTATTGKLRRDQVRREVMSQLLSLPSNL